MSHDTSQLRRDDPVGDWKAFSPEKIPSKGGSLAKMPALFVETLEQLERRQQEKSAAEIGVLPKKKQCRYPEYLSILELGCGCGELSSSLQIRGHFVHGIDVNDAAIEMAKARTTENLTAQRRADRSMIAGDDDENDTNAFGSVMGNATFEVGDIALANESLPKDDYDFCVLQLLLSVVGGHERRRCALQTAHQAMKSGGTIYLSCSGVSDSINPNYKALYQQDAEDLCQEYGEHSYYSRDKDGTVLYITHHFSVGELESLLLETGFGKIRIEQKKETSSRRPDEQAYFLYATAVAE